MLEYLDALIGFAAIMLGLSLIVTIVNQMVSSVLGLRGATLHQGLTTLIQSLHDGSDLPANVKLVEGNKPSGGLVKAVEDILIHPLVSDSAFAWVKRWRLASAIRHDEFVKMIGILGARAERPVLAWLRENHRITATWFDSMMDRVSQHFAMKMRVMAAAVSVLLVLAFQIDTLDIVNNLRGDQQLRLNFVAVADSVNKLGQALPQGDENREQISQIAQSLLAPLRNHEQDQSIGSVLSRPRPGQFYFFGQAGFDWRHFAGVVLSAGLLSLGAPFWFNSLKQLSSLRSVVATKEKGERDQRRLPPDTADGIHWTDVTNG